MSPASHQTIRLSRGRHSSPDDGACAMELASMLAGEPFGDHPASVCPVIGAFLRTYNDSVDDRLRQDLYGVAARAVGTSGGRELVRVRRRRCLDRVARPRRASRLRVVVTGAAAAGQAAARSFVGPAGPRHREALAFLDELVSLPATARRRLDEAEAARLTGAEGLRSP